MCPACVTTMVCVAAGTASGAGLIFGGIVMRIKRLHRRKPLPAAPTGPVAGGLP
jgi:hypothetical protein